MSYQYKPGISREQGMLLPPRIDEYVSEENTVRAIDAYVESLDMAQLGFRHTVGGGGAGQPPYAPTALLKFYFWGYLNRTRSSRRLERETYRNLEVIWLLEGRRAEADSRMARKNSNIVPRLPCVPSAHYEHSVSPRKVAIAPYTDGSMKTCLNAIGSVCRRREAAICAFVPGSRNIPLER
jgi:hypothetical protein